MGLKPVMQGLRRRAIHDAGTGGACPLFACSRPFSTDGSGESEGAGGQAEARKRRKKAAQESRDLPGSRPAGSCRRLNGPRRSVRPRRLRPMPDGGSAGRGAGPDIQKGITPIIPGHSRVRPRSSLLQVGSCEPERGRGKRDTCVPGIAAERGGSPREPVPASPRGRPGKTGRDDGNAPARAAGTGGQAPTGGGFRTGS